MTYIKKYHWSMKEHHKWAKNWTSIQFYLRYLAAAVKLTAYKIDKSVKKRYIITIWVEKIKLFLIRDFTLNFSHTNRINSKINQTENGKLARHANQRDKPIRSELKLKLKSRRVVQMQCKIQLISPNNKVEVKYEKKRQNATKLRTQMHMWL